MAYFEGRGHFRNATLLLEAPHSAGDFARTRRATAPGHEKQQFIQGPQSVARCDDACRRCLSDFEKVPGRRTIRTDGSTETRGGFDPVEHRRGQTTEAAAGFP